MEEGVAPGGGGDGGAVGQQERQPRAGRRLGHRLDGVRQRLTHVVAPGEPTLDEGPAERGVAAGPQPQQIDRRQRRGERRQRLRPAADRAVVAEEVPAAGVRRGGRLGVGARCGGVADRGQQRAGADHSRDAGQAFVGPDRSGAAVAGRFGVARRVPADAETVGVDRAVPLVAGCPRLAVQAVRRIQNDLPDGHGRAQIGEMTAHRSPPSPERPGRPGAPHASPGAASRAVRNPAKICRRTGRSQLRNVPRHATGSTANDPPRSTLYAPPKNASEYSR